METNIYNQKREETGKIDLPENVFGLPWNSDLVHQVVVGDDRQQKNAGSSHPKEEEKSAEGAKSLGGRKVQAKPGTVPSGLRFG